MKLGDIFLVEIPAVSGHEQSGLRPAIVFSESIANTVVVIPCTSNLESLRFSFTVLIHPTKKTGLKTETVGLVFQIRAIDKKRLIKRIGRLDSFAITDVKKLIRKMFFL